MRGARWRASAGVLSRNKGEKGGELMEAAKEGQGELAGKLFPLTGCLLIFLD